MDKFDSFSLTGQNTQSSQLSDTHSTQAIDTKWIENLALEEINMNQSGIVHFNDHLDPSFALEESSISFVHELRDLIETYVDQFNTYLGQSGSPIRIFKISNTVNDFMLFRNSLRLIFSRRADDLIQISFIKNGMEMMNSSLGGKMRNTPNSEERNMTNQGHVHQIRAHLGPFHKIKWTFEGEEVDQKALCRHYLSEFIRNSAT